MSKGLQQYLIDIVKDAQQRPPLEPPENPTETEQWLWDEYGIKKVKTGDPDYESGVNFPRENLIWIILSELEKIDDAELDDGQRECIRELQQARDDTLAAMVSKGAE